MSGWPGHRAPAGRVRVGFGWRGRRRLARGAVLALGWLRPGGMGLRGLKVGSALGDVEDRLTFAFALDEFGDFVGFDVGGAGGGAGGEDGDGAA